MPDPTALAPGQFNTSTTVPLDVAAPAKPTVTTPENNNGAIPDAPKPVTSIVTAPTTATKPVVAPSIASTTPSSASDTNPVYDTSTGFLTPYGVSISAKAAQANDPNAPKTTSTSTTTPPVTPTLPTDSTYTTAIQNSGRAPDQVKSVSNNVDGSRTITFNDGTTQDIGGNPNDPTQALAMSVTASQKAAQTFSDTITGIQNGTIPLSAGDQAQISGLQTQYNNLISSQLSTNANATGSATESAFRGGAGVGSDVMNNIQAVVSAGAQKVASLQSEEAAAVASLTQSLKDGDEAAIKTAYDALQTASGNTQTALQKTIDETTAAINLAKTQQDAITDSINTVAEDAAKNGADPATLKAITSSGTVDDAITAAGSSLQTSSDPTVTAYLQYKKDTIAQGLTPQSYTDYTNAQAAVKSNLAVKQAAAIAGASETAKLAADTAAGILSTQANTDVNTTNTQLQANKDVQAFMSVADQIGVLKGIPDGTTDPSQQSALLASVAHILSPNSSSLRGALNAIDPNSLQSGVYNTLNTIAKQFTAKGTLSPDAVNTLKQIGITEYNSLADTYNTVRSDAIQGLVNRGITNADQYVNNFADVGVTDPKTAVENFVSSSSAKTAISPTLSTKISSLTGGQTFSTAGQLAIYMSGLPGADPTSVLNVLKSLGLYNQ